MEPQMILTIVLAVIACVVVGIVYYRLVTKERSGQQHAGAVNAAPVLPNSALAQCEHKHNDHFTDIHPTTHWRSQLEHAQNLGLGNMDYELITI